MSDLIIKDYELSVWKDVLEDNITPNYSEEFQGVIASSNMDSPCSASNIQLTLSINAANSLAFEIYTKYFDIEKNDYVDNPYYELLFNEVHLKLKYGNDWYDFLIKEISETDTEYKKEITATDLFVEELSKNGYSLEFNADLNNNTGSAQDLVAAIIEDTDWVVDEDSDVIRQYIEEPLYYYKLEENFEAYYTLGDTAVTIPAGKFIYIFYSCYQSSPQANPVQFLYDENQIYEVDDDGIIVESKVFNCYANDFTYPKFTGVSSDCRGKRLARSAETAYDSNTGHTVTVYTKTDESDDNEYYCYTEYEYITQDFVQNIFTQGSDFSSTSGWYIPGKSSMEIEFGYDPELTSTNLTDWASIAKSCLKFTGEKSYSSEVDQANVTDTIRNTSLSSNVSLFMIKDESENATGYFDLSSEEENIFVARSTNKHINMRIYNILSDEVVVNFDFSKNAVRDGISAELSEEREEATDDVLLDDEIWKVTAQIEKDIVYENIDSYVIEVYFNGDAEQDEDQVYTESVTRIELYKYSSFEGKDIRPGQIITVTDDDGNVSISSKVQTVYYFYKKGDTPTSSTTSDAGYEIKYDSNYTKIRSIEGSQTNRFDLIQSVNEAFECWTTFKINREDDGSIKKVYSWINTVGNEDLYAGYKKYYISKTKDGDYDEKTGLYFSEEDPTIYPGDEQNVSDDLYIYNADPYVKVAHQDKSILIKETIGEEKQYGFTYGLNTNSVQRTVNSENLVTKLIVPNNSNEYGTDGYCSIARATENVAQTNFLINFDYYTNKGILDKERVSADLYGSESGEGLAYITKYSKYNAQINALYDKDSEGNSGLTGLYNSRSDYLSEYTLKYQSYIAYDQTLAEQAETINTEYEIDLTPLIDDNDETELTIDLTVLPSDVKGAIEGFILFQQTYSNLEDEYKAAKENYDNNEVAIAEKEAEVAVIQAKINLLDKLFYQKYQNYIKEGTWSSDDYYDDNLYYYDALSSLYVSKSPETSYQIDVVDISLLEEYKFYEFGIGDRTFVYDKEIFGDNREDVVVTEISYNLDDPTSNSITVQNYRTEFADLFSKFAATVTQVELKQGSWDKGGDLLDAAGTLDSATLQESLKNSGDFYNVALSGVHLTSDGIIIGSSSGTPTKVTTT